jgi:FAD-dependent fumarate reductase
VDLVSRGLIKKSKPEYADLPTTNDAQTLGAGQFLIESIGGELIDMERIQIHPTGFIKVDYRDSRWKFLAAESLRGIGVVLFTVDKLERFVNKRDTRDTSKK